MSAAAGNLWARRYEDALAPGEIQRRAETRGSSIANTSPSHVEAVCLAIQRGLEAVNLITAQTESIIRAELERAAAHAAHVYANPQAALSAVYGRVSVSEPYMPTFLTGLAGVGKSRIRQSIRVVLSGNRSICIDEAHPSVPLIDYAECTIGQQRSVGAVLRQLAGPEIAAGRVKISQGDISAECARWQRVAGTCLVGVDEMQFMTQSADATTLTARTLFAVADVGVPWFVVANYSLVGKLLRRPSEALQRLLGRPVVLFPDTPHSADWTALLNEYQVVLKEFLDFSVTDKRSEIWNLCAGLKRELVKLLVQAYRVARSSGMQKIGWLHVEQAFKSLEFSVSRRDIKLLIAHAGQGGSLRGDLACPFEGPPLSRRATAYAEQLRVARQSEVGRAEVEAAMNAQERHAMGEIKMSTKTEKRKSAAIIPLPKKKRKSLESLLEAGQLMRVSHAGKVNDV
jgi:hypothetical protein